LLFELLARPCGGEEELKDPIQRDERTHIYELLGKISLLMDNEPELSLGGSDGGFQKYLEDILVNDYHTQLPKSLRKVFNHFDLEIPSCISRRALAAKKSKASTEEVGAPGGAGDADGAGVGGEDTSVAQTPVDRGVDRAIDGVAPVIPAIRGTTHRSNEAREGAEGGARDGARDGARETRSEAGKERSSKVARRQGQAQSKKVSRPIGAGVGGLPSLPASALNHFTSGLSNANILLGRQRPGKSLIW